MTNEQLCFVLRGICRELDIAIADTQVLLADVELEREPTLYDCGGRHVGYSPPFECWDGEDRLEAWAKERNLEVRYDGPIVALASLRGLRRALGERANMLRV
jgi:hypothetical protein